MASKGLVLVTGANGYIAARTVEAFLKAGYSVRGTVRSFKSAQEVKNALSEYADRLEFVEVPDITVAGAFDEAVKGVDAVAHLASPVAFDFTDPEPVLHSAINGTVRALESAATEPKIKSFVVMSSIVSIVNQKEPPYTYTEADWNNFAEAVVAAQGKGTPGPVIYMASKVAAERAVWKFRDEHKPHFTLTAVNPVFVAGPPLVAPASVDKIGFTTSVVSDVYLGKPLETSGNFGTVPGYVDVRDVARVVVYGVEHADKANNQRYLLSSHHSPSQAVADILREAFPERKGIIQEGNPGQGYEPDYSFPKDGIVFDGSKAVRETGQDYIPWRQTVLDTVEKFKAVLN